MATSVLLAIYGSSAAIALIVMIATLRVAKRTWFRTGLLIYLAGTLWWSVVDFLRWAVPDPSVERFEAWAMPATALVIAGGRLGVSAVARQGWRPGFAEITGFLAHPFIAFAIALTAPLHPLVVTDNGLLEPSYGPIFWLHIAVSLGLLASITVELVRSPLARRFLNRRTAPVVGAIWAVPLVASVVTLVGEGPAGLDLLPPGFALTSLLMWRVVIPANVVVDAPVARAQVFDEIPDAVFVIHADGTLMDANRAALDLVAANHPLEHYVGASLWSLWTPIAEASRRTGEYDLDVGGKERIVDVLVTPVMDSRGARIATAVVMRDVTESAQQRRELALLRAELAEAVIRDTVTGLHNRRYAEQALPDAIARCRAKGTPMSVAVIDVDHFKNVNDTFGHSVGDRVLQVLSRVMVAEAPSSMVARIGGEEFLIMLPGLDAEQARLHAERIREACAAASVATREGPVSVTLSAGVASLTTEVTGEQLIDAADQAMYRAKREGRNRTCVAVPA